jgi:diguanylate cyclase (GGDEF)-like protein
MAAPPGSETGRRRGSAGWHGVLSAVRDRLPRGGALPPETWRSRHRGITGLLWVHVVALPVIGVLRGNDLLPVMVAVALVALLAVGAGRSRFGVTARSAMTTLGLVSSAAILVYLFGGTTELHFHYFVIVAVVALYQAWAPYLLAVGFVLVEHGVVGTVAPGLVFSMNMSASHAWGSAVVHGAFILAESVACVLFWRASEDAIDNEREALGAATSAHLDLVRAQEMASIGSWTLDIATNRMTWSDQMFTLTGQDPDSFIPSLAASLELMHPDDRGRVATELLSAVNGGHDLDLEYRLLRPDQTVRDVHALSEQPMLSDGSRPRRFGTLHDVTERKALQQEIEHLAFHDALTGLANRRLFLDRLELALTRRPIPRVTTAVLYLDLDDFKMVNDTFGHSVGDELLRVTATRLSSSLRASDTVARLGGDEFAILLEQVDYETTHRVAEVIGSEVRRPMQLEGTELSIGTSIGFALAEGSTSAEDLMRNADAAMYAMKSGGDTAPGVFPNDPSKH